MCAQIAANVLLAGRAVVSLPSAVDRILRSKDFGDGNDKRQEAPLQRRGRSALVGRGFWRTGLREVPTTASLGEAV